MKSGKTDWIVRRNFRFPASGRRLRRSARPSWLLLATRLATSVVRPSPAAPAGSNQRSFPPKNSGRSSRLNLTTKEQPMAVTNTSANEHRVASREAWLKERLALLNEEKKLTRQQDAIAQQVRDLPWVKVDKEYTFDSPSGKKSLFDLFESRSQLVVYHFMFDPTWSQGCKS